MTGEEYIANELKNHNCICYYPSSGTDLSNIDYFGSGKKLWSERLGDSKPANDEMIPVLNPDDDPDLFIHSDINFYQEFEAGLDTLPDNSGIHANFEIVKFRELPRFNSSNSIFNNYAHSGRCFEYKFKVWNSDKIRTLIYCLCENEYLVSKVFLANQLNIKFIWSRNWAGGYTYGTWLVNILDKLHTSKVYTDWLCVPGKRGEPRNKFVEEKYPELMTPPNVELQRNNNIRWIDEGASGWVEEFDVVIKSNRLKQ